ncbi:hypothetical protein D3C86_912800 [compost metagenome]
MALLRRALAVGRRGAGAVQVLTPKQEFDGVIARGHVGLVAVGFVQYFRQQFRRDLADVDRLAAHRDLRIGDDVDGVEGVFVVFGTVRGVDIVDQAFVQRPGVHAAFPVVNDGVAESIRFGLLVRHAGRQPGFARGLQRVGAGLGDQRVDGRAQRLGGGQRVFITRQRQVRIGGDHGARLCRRVGRSPEYRCGQHRSQQQLAHRLSPVTRTVSAPAAGHSDFSFEDASVNNFRLIFSPKSDT